MLKENEKITLDEWNNYAMQQNLLSGITLLARENIITWDDLKQIYLKRKRKLLVNINAVWKKVQK